MYPTISDKAGLYIFNIISNHIFQDGNKRTELASAILFIIRTNHKLKNGLSKVKVNEKSIPEKGNSRDEILEEAQEWFKENVILQQIINKLFLK